MPIVTTNYRALTMSVISLLSLAMIFSGCGVANDRGNINTVSANLTWTPPDDNTDGSALVDLEGYLVFYGRESGKLSFKAIVYGDNYCTIHGLARGTTYYFAVTAFDTYGNNSTFSNEVEILIEGE